MRNKLLAIMFLLIMATMFLVSGCSNTADPKDAAKMMETLEDEGILPHNITYVETMIHSSYGTEMTWTTEYKIYQSDDVYYKIELTTEGSKDSGYEYTAYVSQCDKVQVNLTTEKEDPEYYYKYQDGDNDGKYSDEPMYDSDEYINKIYHFKEEELGFLFFTRKKMVLVD